MNVVPGMSTLLHYTPTLTTAENRVRLKNPNFDFVLLCNKICGPQHYNMQMKVVVENQNDFDNWCKKPG